MVSTILLALAAGLPDGTVVWHTSAEAERCFRRESVEAAVAANLAALGFDLGRLPARHLGVWVAPGEGGEWRARVVVNPGVEGSAEARERPLPEATSCATLEKLLALVIATSIVEREMEPAPAPEKVPEAEPQPALRRTVWTAPPEVPAAVPDGRRIWTEIALRLLGGMDASARSMGGVSVDLSLSAGSPFGVAISASAFLPRESVLTADATATRVHAHGALHLCPLSSAPALLLDWTVCAGAALGAEHTSSTGLEPRDVGPRFFGAVSLKASARLSGHGLASPSMSAEILAPWVRNRSSYDNNARDTVLAVETPALMAFLGFGVDFGFFP